MSNPLTPEQKKKIADRNDAWWKAHPDKLREKWRRHSNSVTGRAKAKRHREKYIEKVRASRREWQKKNWAHRKEYLKSYEKKNAEKLKKYRKEYWSKHPGTGQARRAAKAKATIEDARLISEWMSEVRSKPFGRCYWCGTKVPGSKIHFDHIVALHLNGTHSIGNLCVSCKECNLSKQKKAVVDWICQGQTFLSL